MIRHIGVCMALAADVAIGCSDDAKTLSVERWASPNPGSVNAYCGEAALLAYSIDGYVGLTPEQDQFVKERAAGLMAWHRATQLRLQLLPAALVARREGCSPER